MKHKNHFIVANDIKIEKEKFIFGFSFVFLLAKNNENSILAKCSNVKHKNNQLFERSLEAFLLIVLQCFYSFFSHSLSSFEIFVVFCSWMFCCYFHKLFCAFVIYFYFGQFNSMHNHCLMCLSHSPIFSIIFHHIFSIFSVAVLFQLFSNVSALIVFWR